MISIISNSQHSHARDLVAAAFCRSVTPGLVKIVSPGSIKEDESEVIVCINPDIYLSSKIYELFERNNIKIIVFGALPKNFTSSLCLDQVSVSDSCLNDFICSPAYKNSFSESNAKIDYTIIAKEITGIDLMSRPVCRYDFESEWNNIGYGAIKNDGSIWSISSHLRARPENEVAKITFENSLEISFAAMFNGAKSSLLWINRPVGLIDSGEWIIIEKFISCWGHERYPCLPTLSDIPFGFDSLISMRLDCDEDLDSARCLWQKYRDNLFPFSIAVHTNILNEQKNIETLKDMSRLNVAVMSHSQTHAADWGGSYENALQEAIQSRVLLETLTQKNIKYAVSPFHQTPHYALQALSDAGYHGCIGGIICNDPDFLLGRGGLLANMPDDFIGHSQQCMLHGDCLLNERDPLRIYKQAFDFSQMTKTAFCYLDHPISNRYDYGWGSERRRVDIHIALIEYFRSNSINPCILNEIDLMNYFLNKSRINIFKYDDKFLIDMAFTDDKCTLYPAVTYRSNIFDIKYTANLQ